MSAEPSPPGLAAAVDALVDVAGAAGIDQSVIRAEAAALVAAAADGVPGAADAWADEFDGHRTGFANAARAGRFFSGRATPVLAQLVAGGSAQAEAYAHALADVASAACSVGDPSLDAIQQASLIAAAQLDTILPPAPPSPPAADHPDPAPAPPTPGAPSGPPATPAAGDPAGPTGSATAGATATQAASAEQAAPPAKTLEELLAELDDLVGLDKVKDEVRQQAEVLRIGKLRTAKELKDPSMTRHLIFVGNPGTGKTTVARLVAGIYRALGVLAGGQLVECDRSSLVAGYVGQTALKTTDMATKALGGALFIDEAYSLAGDEYGEEAIDTLVKQMEDHRAELVVIVAGYPAPMDRFINANPGLASRFRLTLTFEDYTDDQLVEIFTKVAAESDFTPGPGCIDQLRQILTLTPREEGFGNARFVRNLFEGAVVRQAWRLRDQADPTVDQLRELTAADLGPLPDTLHPPADAAADAQAIIDALPPIPGTGPTDTGTTADTGTADTGTTADPGTRPVPAAPSAPSAAEHAGDPTPPTRSDP